jgi:hypothetical protein
MNAKYAGVVKISEVLAFLDVLPRGMFDLPKGQPVARAQRYARRRGVPEVLTYRDPKLFTSPIAMCIWPY